MTAISDLKNERDRPNISLPARCFSGRDAGAALAELCRRCANNDTDGSARTDETQWFRAESQSLVSWADTHGWLWSDPHLEEITQGLDCFEGGAEHSVFSTVEISWVLKITKPPGFGLQSSLCKYLRNILWSNRLFGDDIRFEGVIQRGDGASILTSQPFLKGRAPSLQEIELWFSAKGYVRCGYNKWCNAATGTVVADAHIGNFIVIESGKALPIDLQILEVGTG